MASSPPNKKHWPSMFRSKHGSQLWQPQPDMGCPPPSLVSGSILKSHFLSGTRAEERSSDPKPRWCPRPEQIRILEAIFNSGMVNPTRDEIPRIRMRLQEYGQVGDANVFYWFQNRKSRSKVKARTAAAARATQLRACPPALPQQAAEPFTPSSAHPKQPQPQQQQLLFPPVAPSSSSSSSSDRSSGSSKPVKQLMSATGAMDLLSPLAAACHQQMHYQSDQPVVSTPAPAPALDEFVAADVEPIFLPWPQGHCLTAGEVAAILGAQYTQMPVQQPPAASPAGTILELYNEFAAPTTTGLRSSPCGAGLDQYCPSGNADQPSFGKSFPPPSTSVSSHEAHGYATKLRTLQYGFGISTTPTVNATAAATSAVLPLPASPEPAVTVASAAAATAGLTSLSTTAISAGAVTFDQLLGPADAGFAGGGVARGAAVVCVAGTGAAYSVPAAQLDVKACFGEGAVLFRCDGEHAEPLLVDESSSGLTVEPLQHGGVYYCVII